MLNRDRVIRIIQWLIILLLFSYDGFTYLPEESNFALYKSLYYMAIFICFIILITLNMRAFRVPYIKLGPISYAIQIFIWLYFLRLYYDFMIAGIDQEIVSNPFAAVFLYMNAAIIPFYGFYFFRWELIDLRKLNTALLLIILTMGLASMWYIITGKALEYLGADGRFMGNASMDTIAFGHLGTTITILAISLFYQKDIHLWHKILCIISIFIGLFIMIAAGSRGAIVALIACFLAYLYMNGHKMKIMIGLPVLIVVILTLLPFVNDILLSYDNHALERVYTSIYEPNNMDSGVTSGRDILYKEALERFVENPIVGTSIFVNGEYVHNSVFEAFLGLGILGGCLFVWIIGSVFVKAIRLGVQNKQYLCVSLLFIQYIVYSLFSRTLSMLPLFWLSMYIIIYLKNYENKKGE